LALDVEIKRRQFFGICCGNCYDWLVFEFACCFNDLPLVGLNSNWNSIVMSHVINLSEIVCIACAADAVAMFQSLKPFCPSLSALVIINTNSSDSLPVCEPLHPLKVFVWDSSSLRMRMIHTPVSCGPSQGTIVERDANVYTHTCVGMSDFTLRKLRGQLPHLDQSDAHTLMFTSGSSGLPKGVVVSKQRWYSDNQSGGAMAHHTDPAFLSFNSWSHGADRGIAEPFAFMFLALHHAAFFLIQRGCNAIMFLHFVPLFCGVSIVQAISG
jgi:long-subunit acyl-CoA synthetase (AMP-forming)